MHMHTLLGSVLASEETIFVCCGRSCGLEELRFFYLKDGGVAVLYPGGGGGIIAVFVFTG